MFKILVVEDDTELRSLFCRVLMKNGYQTFRAGDGEEALEVLDHEYVDLILCDVMMPRMDGFELTRELRAAGMTMPVLMITAKDAFGDKREGFDAGADDYMVKPIDVNEMVLRVGALLRRSKSASSRKLTVGNTTLDYDTLTVRTPEGETTLPQKEFQLLYKLLIPYLLTPA